MATIDKVEYFPVHNDTCGKLTRNGAVLLVQSATKGSGERMS